MAQNTSEGAGAELNNAASGTLGTASTAKKGVGLLTKGGSSGKTALFASKGTASAVGTFLGGIFLFLLIFGSILTLFPFLTSNSVLHQSDTENLSADNTLNFVSSAYSTDDIKKMTQTYEENKSEIQEIFDAGRQRAIRDISRDIDGQYVVDSWIDDGANIEDEVYLLFAAGYSASVGNALSDNAFDYFMNTSAIRDMGSKMSPLLKESSTSYPFGNLIYGADYVRDSDGNIVTRIVEEVSYEGDPPEEITTTTVHVNVKLYIATLPDISLAAFGFDVMEPYDPDSALIADHDLSNSSLFASSAETYYDIITEMALTMGEVLFGADYWNSHNIFYLSSTGTANDNIVSVANSQVAVDSNGKFVKTTGLNYIRWYNSVAGTSFGSGTPWCAIFTSWCMAQAGYGNSVMPPFASCRYGVSWFKSQNRWVSSSGYSPKAGDIIFFDWPNSSGFRDAAPDHVGIVSMCDGTKVYTIEGNSSNSVARREYSLYSASILGYGIPNYPTSSD